MPCKHEGGTDGCVFNTSGACRIRKQQDWADFIKRRPDYRRNYHIANHKTSLVGVSGKADSGYAGELVVRTDILLRGLVVTVPENRSCPDDLHFKSSKGWVSVQVKVANVNKTSGHWSCFRRKNRPITSDVIAWVDLRTREIRYESNTKPVPKELLT